MFIRVVSRESAGDCSQQHSARAHPTGDGGRFEGGGCFGNRANFLIALAKFIAGVIGGLAGRDLAN